MPFVLIVAGIVLITVAVRGTHQEFYQLVKGDFIGPNNFIYWVIAIAVIGAIGYVPRLKPISDGFLILVILALFLNDKRGFFKMFEDQIAQTQHGSSTSGVSVGASRGGVVIQPGGSRGGSTPVNGGVPPIVISL
jgi:hypothetical protein